MLELGTAIRIVRQAKGLRSGQLAKAAGMSAPFLSLVESGRKQPSLEMLRRIAGALEVPSEALILLAHPTSLKLKVSDAEIDGLTRSVRALAAAEKSLAQRLKKRGKK
jgi:transcriptional regulator with XRE-family HTH domain